MIITCETCNTSFNLDDKLLKPEGSKVRCSVCANVFTAYPKQVLSFEAVEETEIPEKESPPPELPADPDDVNQLAADREEITHEKDADVPVGGESELEELDIEIEDGDDAVFQEDLASIQNESSDELDFSLDLDPASESDETIIADLDDELDFSLESSPVDADATIIADLDEDDFELDAPFVSDDDSEGMETIIADLEDDFSLEFGDAGDATSQSDDASVDVADDFGDLDLSLDLDEDRLAEKEHASDSLDIEDDLDLSGLEDLLEDDQASVDDTATVLIDPADEPELSFELSDDSSLDKEGIKVSGDALDELEFDLESDDSLEEVDFNAAEDEQDIDLSEIEKMLEDPDTENAQSSTVPDQDLDLDIEASLDTEKWMAKSGEENMLVQDDEIDLTELEHVLEDVVDTQNNEQPTEEPELSLDIDESGDALPLDEPSKMDGDMELDFSDFEMATSDIGDAKEVDSDSVDMELEFEVESDGQGEQTLEDEALAETVAVTSPEPKTDELPPSEPEGATEPPPAPKPAKKDNSKSLVFLLIIILMGGGAYGAYYLMNQKGVEIPFFSDYLKPKVNDPGNLKLSTYDINSKFIDNSNVGKLFVISGKIKNGYSDNRGMITLEGNLFSAGKVPVNKEKVYCGNIMSDLELTNLEWDKIKSRLSNRLGDDRSNVKIEPGKSIPFMVVFSGLPDDLEEFTIEVTGSTVLK